MLIFDFDGVICDSFKAVILAINAIAEGQGVKSLLMDDFEINKFRQIETIEIFQKFGIEHDKITQVIILLQKALAAQLNSLKVVDGIKESLNTLWRSKIKMGILSSNSEENIILFLKQHGINFFDFIYSGTFSNKGEILKNIVYQLNYEPKNVFYIGDESRDILASREANICSVAVTWGFNAKEVLIKHAPHHLIDSPMELTSLFMEKYQSLITS